MPQNRAAWNTAKGVTKLEVKEAAYTSPGRGEIVVQSRAVATNPVDILIARLPSLLFPWTKYPAIFGLDVAGEVVEVGPGAERFKVGDRVIGQARAVTKAANRPAEGGFQNFVILQENLASTIPETLSYEKAAVLPLPFSTASRALFSQDALALDLPTVPRAKVRDEWVIIWGASTAVGLNAVQLAKAAGFSVVATAGKRNHDYVRELGADVVFDYKDTDVAAKIIAELKGKSCAGAVAIGEASAPTCVDIVGVSKSSRPKKTVVQLSPPAPMPRTAPSGLGFVSFVGSFLSSLASLWLKTKWRGVSSGFVDAADLFNTPAGNHVYRDYLPAALAEGVHVAAPEPLVVGHGLEKVQEALELHDKGVSAQKPIVTL